MTTFFAHETAELIRAYAAATILECMGEGEDGTYDHLLDAIVLTDATTAEACCHMGRALICLEEGLSDPPFRLGGDMCDPRVTEISVRLGMLDAWVAR